jgi:hypothetical protein
VSVRRILILYLSVLLLVNIAWFVFLFVTVDSLFSNANDELLQIVILPFVLVSFATGCVIFPISFSQVLFFGIRSYTHLKPEIDPSDKFWSGSRLIFFAENLTTYGVVYHKRLMSSVRRMSFSVLLMLIVFVLSPLLSTGSAT